MAVGHVEDEEAHLEGRAADLCEDVAKEACGAALEEKALKAQEMDHVPMLLEGPSRMWEA